MNPLYCPYCNALTSSHAENYPTTHQGIHCGEDFILPGEERPADILQAFNDRLEIDTLKLDLEYAGKEVERVEKELT